MSDKYKIGLSRNRLFSFDNAVVFVGKCKASLDRDACVKAVKTLALKEPLITASVEIAEDASAYVVTEKCSVEIKFTDESPENIKAVYEKNGIDFSDRLFEFVVCGGNTLVIVGHTVMCDCKSLLRLAKEFVEIYEDGIVSVEPCRVMAFGDISELPGNMSSPLTDKLSADIDSKWKKKKVYFSDETRCNARNKYADIRPEAASLYETVSAESLKSLGEYCESKGIDYSSVVSFAFFKALTENLKLRKREKKFAVFADRRFFINGTDKCNVAPFNGYVDVSLKGKGKNGTLEEQLKAFHFNHYKNVTSAYRSFYGEIILMKVSPDFCDASHMAAAGAYSSGVAKRLAENYGCKNTCVSQFFSCDLRQEYWSRLSFFESVDAYEPFSQRFFAMVNLITDEDGSRILFRYNRAKINDEVALQIKEKAFEIIEKIK